jgi:hypothetical protein
MRTNIEIHEALLAEAQAVTGAATKKETVQLGPSTSFPCSGMIWRFVPLRTIGRCGHGASRSAEPST